MPGLWKAHLARLTACGAAEICMLPWAVRQFFSCHQRFHLTFGHAGALYHAAAGALGSKANGAALLKLREPALLAPFQVGRAKARKRILYDQCSVGWLHQVDPIGTSIVKTCEIRVALALAVPLRLYRRSYEPTKPAVNPMPCLRPDHLHTKQTMPARCDVAVQRKGRHYRPLCTASLGRVQGLVGAFTPSVEQCCP